MRVIVEFFGPARDWAGAAKVEIDLPDTADAASLRAALKQRFPGLADRLDRTRLAVNEAFAPDDAALRDGDRVAVIPPVTGGQNDPDWIALTTEPIDVAAVRRFVDGDARCGAVSTFDGVVRTQHDSAHGALVRLDYEAYREMALAQMRRIVAEARQSWPVLRAAVVHRLGPVAVGEVSVAIAVASPHREESFAACRYLIDELKRDVPIWKRDVFEDGHLAWVEPAVKTRNQESA
ncbi:MAG: molybdenum cofactor biosynthesis protein MoaE [Phycisphaerae bacterium]|nr:molybdenum cofactor biosynthesis protein MoaE [Planctomycetia bacterium]MCK6464867.1 molybdenum cofactor biosynthesis protein MoaE [Phycisphaerae bacterium]MCL4719730.1 molybdenum cofactor biosynthesis protein MoaE [Phycisphaerae bacterium]NUQ10023.1 molybdenum cofactor biosynthesis protein MoaE [Phycisphaerae bacterium]